jgi:predicted nicotinamide N-methyase
MSDQDALQLRSYQFGEAVVNIHSRRGLKESLRFATTLQVELEDMWNSLNGFGGGWDSDDEPQCDPEDKDPDMLGLDVWPGAVALAQYLAAQPQLVEGKQIQELGAGVP